MIILLGNNVRLQVKLQEPTHSTDSLGAGLLLFRKRREGFLGLGLFDGAGTYGVNDSNNMSAK